MAERPLGRRVPTDWNHVTDFAFSAVAPPVPRTLERTLPLPAYRAKYNQRREGACVGFSASWLMSILNRRFYDARWLWNEAKKVDEWADTNPGDDEGTSVRAAMDVLRDVGHCRILRGKTQPAAIPDGIQENRWATTVDQIRSAINAGTPVALGIDWHVNFDTPEKVGRNWWIGRGRLGRVRGGHAVCVYRASDQFDAVGIVNNWGVSTPLVLMPYEVLQRLLDHEGEAALVTDRVNGRSRPRRVARPQ